MKIASLSLEKFCQHDLDLSFSNGLICIQGPNGSGKTNLLEGIIFAITGKSSRSLNSLVQFGAKKSVVEIKGLLNKNIEFSIKRTIPSATIYSSIGGKSYKLTASKTLEKFLEAGIDLLQLAKTSFVPQGSLVQFSEFTPLQIQKELNALFGLSKFEKLSSLLLEFIPRPVPIPQLPAESPDVDQIQNEISSIRKKLEEIDIELQKHENSLDASEAERLKNELSFLSKKLQSNNLILDLVNKFQLASNILCEEKANLPTTLFSKLEELFIEIADLIYQLSEKFLDSALNQRYDQIQEELKKDVFDKLPYTQQQLQLKSQLDSKMSLLKMATSYKDIVQKYNEAVRINEHNKVIKDKLEKIRAVFHSSGFPALVAKQLSACLCDMINLAFKNLDVNFVLKDDFESIYVDGKLLELSQLSCGQKVIVGIAYQVAKNDMFFPGGFLIFDEPSAFLDQMRRSQLANLLNSLSRNRQIFVVSHDVDFVSLLNSNQVFDLD